MKRTALASVLILALSFSAMAETQFANLTSAQTFENITIQSDGSIKPTAAHIIQAGNIYTLTGNNIWLRDN